jgi:hypothetical protein
MNAAIRNALLILALTLTLLAAPHAHAEDAYYVEAILGLDITEGELPERQRPSWMLNDEGIYPYVVLDGAGEAYVTPTNMRWGDGDEGLRQSVLAVRAPIGEPITGRLILPGAYGEPMVMVRFAIDPALASAEHEKRFNEIAREHYRTLRNARIPGGAWFRHQERAYAETLGLEADAERERPQDRWWEADELERTCALITGGRALAENIQLDRVLELVDDDAPSIAIDTIEGVTVREYDWAARAEGLEPELDPLAPFIPDDQHAVFFPSFDAMLAVVDELEEQGGPALFLYEPNAQHALVRQRYETQLCLPLTDLARRFGPQMVKTVAITGSDPYWRTGSDVAVLLEAHDAIALHRVVNAVAALMTQNTPDIEQTAGEYEGVAWTSLTTPDRSFCSYLAVIGDAVIVTNSLAQLERVISASKQPDTALASSDEYRFFRHRYPRGTAHESGFLILTDATIRRWCSPRWRIATSRRTRAAALLADLQATYLDQLVSGEVAPGPIHAEHLAPLLGDITLAPTGVMSSAHGALHFQTPIIELPIDAVSQAEADAYIRWRDRYQSNWSGAFDPIAIQCTVAPDRIGVDGTVMPLIGGTQYDDMIELTAGAAIAPDAGDPHADAIMHYVTAVNRDMPMLQMFGGMAVGPAQFDIDPLGWLGQSAALYADDDPFWDELADARADDDDIEPFMRDNISRLPMALWVEVDSGFKLTAFLTAVRAMIEQTAPGMTEWSNHEHNGMAYVRVGPSAEAQRQSDDAPDDLALYYAPGGEALIVSLCPDMIFKALDRQAARRTARDAGEPIERATPPWLGESVSMQVRPEVMRVASMLFGEDYRKNLRRLSWRNLHILNEWRRRYPHADPLAVHEQFCGVRLICPAGGSYTWNDQWATMQSTVFGHPGEPELGGSLPDLLNELTFAEFGLTFIDDGLRATFNLQRGADPAP